MKKYNNLIGTGNIKIKYFLPTIDELIIICSKYNVKKVIVFFGDPSWGYSYYTSKGYKIEEREISVNMLHEEINEAKNSTNWHSELGSDDLYIIIPSYQIKIYYNHHSRIYISYDDRNDFLDDVLSYYTKKSIVFN